MRLALGSLVASMALAIGTLAANMPIPVTPQTRNASTSIVTQLEQMNNNDDRRQTKWQVEAAFEGQTFFDNFDFFSAEDPNHGSVTYVDRPTAFMEGLAFWTQNGQPGLQVEHWANLTEGTPRRSVRISSKTAFGGGLFLFDMALIPWGCGVWTAVWMVAPDWPHGGEIDVIESVHMIDPQYTVHTGSGCTLGADTSGYTGTKIMDNCDSTSNGAGCSIVAPSEGSLGETMNPSGGGVFALLWDGDGLKIWKWNRADVPSDISARNPTPLQWGLPVAAFHRSTCDPYVFFQPQTIVLNINLCGDWAGNTYSSTQYCPGTCASRITDPANLVNTVMIVNSILVYQQTSNTTESGGVLNTKVGAAGPINPLAAALSAARRGADLQPYALVALAAVGVAAAYASS